MFKQTLHAKITRKLILNNFFLSLYMYCFVTMLFDYIEYFYNLICHTAGLWQLQKSKCWFKK